MKNRLRRTPRRALILVMCLSLMLCISLGVFTVGAAAQSVGKYNNMKVILGGVPFGVKFNTDGVVVVGFSDIDGTPKAQNPAYVAGLRPKDIITKVNGRKLADAADLTSTVESSDGQALSLTYMRGGVENYLGTVMGKHSVKPCPIAHRADLHGKVKCLSVLSLKLLLDIVGIIFVDIKYNKLFRRAFCNLTAKLTTYRAAATCNHNNTVFDIIHNRSHINIYRFSTQKVFNFNVSE